MIPPDESHEARQIALALAGALEQATLPGASGGALAMARDVAQMLALEGLDRALQGLERHAGGAWPEPLAPLLERVAALRGAAFATESIEVFQRADLELAGLAAELEALEWAPGAGAGAAPLPTLAAAEVLEGLAGPEDAVVLERTRLSAPVAAALRAALDWLGGSVPRRPVRVRAEDSMLEVWIAVAEPAGLRAASDVLGAVEGSLGPVDGAAPPGTWRVRVPTHAPRPAFLMVLQGDVRLALPWHSVLHVHMLPAADVADARPAAAVLAPLVPCAGDDEDERPVVMLAHGLRRAWMVADRLVWRLPADPCDTPAGPPAPCLAGAVRTDEGETWWRVDVARLLADVEPLAVPDLAALPREAAAPLPSPAAATPSVRAADTTALPWGEGSDAAPAPEAAPVDEAGAAAWVGEESAWDEIDEALAVLDGACAPAPAAGPAAVEPAPPPPHPAPAPVPPPRREILTPDPAAPPAARAPQPAPPPPVAPRTPAPLPALRVLRPGDVFALPASARELDASSVEPAFEPRPAEVAPPRAVAAAPAPRRALVAEDSLMARIFLTRLLERRGFETHGVGTAAELVFALARGPWTLVCVDVELPDARGEELVRGVRLQLERRPWTAALVALVRDAEDASLARAAGVPAQLRKPFEESELDAALDHAGLSAPR